MMLKYQYISARTAEYNGLVFIPLDGAIHQLTWDIEVNVGVKTTISMNNEHSVVVPRYPNRRRNELVDPDAFMEFYNRLDRDAFDFVPPR